MTEHFYQEFPPPDAQEKPSVWDLEPEVTALPDAESEPVASVDKPVPVKPATEATAAKSSTPTAPAKPSPTATAKPNGEPLPKPVAPKPAPPKPAAPL